MRTLVSTRERAPGSHPRLQSACVTAHKKGHNRYLRGLLAVTMPACLWCATGMQWEGVPVGDMLNARDHPECQRHVLVAFVFQRQPNIKMGKSY